MAEVHLAGLNSLCQAACCHFFQDEFCRDGEPWTEQELGFCQWEVG